MSRRPSETGRPVEILLVEDNPGDIRLIREGFKDAQLTNTLHVAEDGEEALDFVHQRGEYTDAPRPDVILLDLGLPKVDGEEVLAELNEEPDLNRIPVIVLTVSEAAEDIIQSYDLNANAFLTKPVDGDEFVELVRTFEKFWLTLVRLPPRDDDDMS